MAQLKITGYSDDNVEVDGAIREEYGAYDRGADKPVLVAVSDGTLLRVWYDNDGLWRISVVANGTARLTKTEGSITEDRFDEVLLEGSEFLWVSFGDAAALAGK